MQSNYIFFPPRYKIFRDFSRPFISSLGACYTDRECLHQVVTTLAVHKERRQSSKPIKLQLANHDWIWFHFWLDVDNPVSQSNSKKNTYRWRDARENEYWSVLANHDWIWFHFWFGDKVWCEICIMMQNQSKCDIQSESCPIEASESLWLKQSKLVTSLLFFQN